jgi:hypothetical protein
LIEESATPVQWQQNKVKTIKNRSIFGLKEGNLLRNRNKPKRGKSRDTLLLKKL